MKAHTSDAPATAVRTGGRVVPPKGKKYVVIVFKNLAGLFRWEVIDRKGQCVAVMPSSNRGYSRPESALHAVQRVIVALKSENYVMQRVEKRPPWLENNRPRPARVGYGWLQRVGVSPWS